MIWFKPTTLDELRQRIASRPGLSSHLGIEFTELGPDFLSGRMPVDGRTHQPDGLLHGGASCVLAETLGSVAGGLVVDRETARVVGLEINANHIKAVSRGFVVGTARPLHVGKTTQVWEIRIDAEESRALVCISRLTLAVVRAK
jgi:1,4-dihydroxy-2-naphthoyl-CoA hydrolase